MIFCDIDGTLSDNRWRVDLAPEVKNRAENWEAYHADCDKDAPVLDVIQALRLLAMRHSVTYVSSRNVTVQEKTRAWLFMHGAPDGNFMLRELDNHLPPAAYKLGVLGEWAKPGDIFVDDDPVIIDAVREERPDLIIIQVPSFCGVVRADDGKSE